MFPIFLSSSSSKFSSTNVVIVVMIPINRFAHARITNAELKQNNKIFKDSDNFFLGVRGASMGYTEFSEYDLG